MLDVIYALIQVIHNGGAALVAGVAGSGLAFAGADRIRQARLARWAMLGWLIQGLSGIGFGLASRFVRGQVPEITGVAFDALVVKIACTLGGIAVGFWVARRTRRHAVGQGPFVVLLACAGVALGAAAVLRWFL